MSDEKTEKTDTNETEGLIDELVRTARPVKPVRPPYMQAVLWLAVTAVIAAIGISLYGVREDLWSALTHPAFFLEGTALLAAGVMATFAVFQLSLPRDPVPARALLLLGGSALILLISKISCLALADPAAMLGHITAAQGRKITLFGLLFLAIPAVYLFILLKKAAPVHLTWTISAAVIAVGSFASLSCKFICPISEPGYLFVWHYIPIVILLAVGISLRDRILRW